jgi:hypothetical protein
VARRGSERTGAEATGAEAAADFVPYTAWETTPTTTKIARRLAMPIRAERVLNAMLKGVIAKGKSVRTVDSIVVSTMR